MEHTPIKTYMQSGEIHHQAMSAYQRVILVRYNPTEEVATINKLDKYYFTKIKTSVNRVNSNAIGSAKDARAGQCRVEC